MAYGRPMAAAADGLRGGDRGLHAEHEYSRARGWTGRRGEKEHRWTGGGGGASVAAEARHILPGAREEEGEGTTGGREDEGARRKEEGRDGEERWTGKGNRNISAAFRLALFL